MRGVASGAGAPRGAAGFTLLEVAVALAVLGVAMTLVFGIFRLQRRAYDLQAEDARMRKNLSTAMKSLERDLRRAGFGIPPGVAVRVPPDLSGTPAARMVSGLGVADGGASGPDRLYVAYLASEPGRLLRDMHGAAGELELADAGGFHAGDLAVVFDSRDADLFRVAHADAGRLAHRRPGSPGDALGKAYRAGAHVARAAFAGYRIGGESEAAGVGLVRTAADAGGGVRTVTVAEGIEDLQVRLVRGGAERDGEGLADDPAPLADAALVRLHLTARSSGAAAGLREGPSPRWNRTDVSALEPYRRHPRRHVEGLFDLRNRRTRR